MTVEKLKHELTEKLKLVPGYVPGFLQPIENRILMLYTGIRAQVGVKIFGDNLDSIQRKAFEVERAGPGSARRGRRLALARAGQAVPEIEVDREAMARYGLRASEVLEVVEVGIGGKERHHHHRRPPALSHPGAPGTQRARRHRRTGAHPHRHDARHDTMAPAGAMSAPTFGAPSAGELPLPYIPLGKVAKITREIGASEIASENGRLRVFVQANVQDRDLGGFVEEVEQKLAHRSIGKA